jgi:hypothetical protein
MMHRRLVAPFVGILLALTLAFAPVSAARTPTIVVNPVCAYLVNVQLPDSPIFQAVWNRILASLGCGLFPV